MSVTVLTYDVAIATKNRPNALQMSLPLIAKQTVKPKRLIIVDASDDHKLISSTVESALIGYKVNLILVQSKVSSSAHQRNICLEHVTAPIVIMPDDDSLWFPDTAQQILNVYQLDKTGLVGGVTGRQSLVSPINEDQHKYQISRSQIVKSWLQPYRNAVENRFFQQPFKAYAHELWDKLEDPEWADVNVSHRVETMGGFRMSFRSEVIKRHRFDELLGYRSGYCQHEDMEVSLRIQQAGHLLFSAERARVFHHIFPSKRTNGFEYGFGQVANYAYVCSKLIPRSSRAFRKIDRYLRYKVQVYKLKRDPYSREVFRGARAALIHREALIHTSADRAGDAFRELCDKVSANGSV